MRWKPMRVAAGSLGAAVFLGLVAHTAASPLPTPDFHFIPGTFNPQVGPDGNTVILTAPSGLVVIDTGRHPAHTRQILDYAAARDLPIAAIVNTHWHLDHATGNLDIKAAFPGVTVYATRAIEGALEGFLAPSIQAARERVADPAADAASRDRAERFLSAIDQGVVQPDVAVDAGRSLPLDGRDLQLKVTRNAVTESDIWAWDPASRTIVAGDLVTLPVPLFDTGCAAGWRMALDEIAALPIERVVPGHGYVMSADEFRLYHNAFNELLACAAEKSGAECAEGWLEDAATLLDKAAGEDFADQAYARAAATYYVDEIIRSPEKQQALCSAPVH